MLALSPLGVMLPASKDLLFYGEIPPAPAAGRVHRLRLRGPGARLVGVRQGLPGFADVV